MKNEYPEAHNELGYSLHQLRRYAEAVLSYQAAIRQKPDYASAYYNLGITYKALGNRTGAMDQYRALQKIDATRAQNLLTQINN